jgi:hypothetical protein
MLRNADGRAFRGHQWCAADPGSIVVGSRISVLRSSAESAAPRPGHEREQANP